MPPESGRVFFPTVYYNTVGTTRIQRGSGVHLGVPAKALSRIITRMCSGPGESREASLGQRKLRFSPNLVGR